VPAVGDVVPVLKFLLAQLKEKRTTMNALQQLPMMLASMPYPRQQGGPWGNMSWEAVKIAQKQVAIVEQVRKRNCLFRAIA
jgi:hypothetical protein